MMPSKCRPGRGPRAAPGPVGVAGVVWGGGGSRPFSSAVRAWGVGTRPAVFLRYAAAFLRAVPLPGRGGRLSPRRSSEGRARGGAAAAPLRARPRPRPRPRRGSARPCVTGRASGCPGASVLRSWRSPLPVALAASTGAAGEVSAGEGREVGRLVGRSVFSAP